MNRSDIRKYNSLLADATHIQKSMDAILAKLEAVPIVKDKVQSSQKDWPYIMAHVTVDAPDPARSKALHDKLNALKRKQTENFIATVELAGEIMDSISQIPDPRTRAILRAVIFENKAQKDLAIEFDLTEARISQIIKEALDE